MPTTAIVLFQNDLRCQDNPALTKASEFDCTIALYIHDPQPKTSWPLGAASKWWLHHSLDQLDHELINLGGSLILRKGRIYDVLSEIITDYKASHIFFNHLYDPEKRSADAQTFDTLKKNFGIEVKGYHGNLLRDPDGPRNQSGNPYQVFTPYWRAFMRAWPRIRLSPAPQKLQTPTNVATESLNGLKLLPGHNWHRKLLSAWQPGSQQAQKRLKKFLDSGLKSYKQNRDIPSKSGTSLLSPHLHFGEISPKQIVHAMQQRKLQDSEGAREFLRELGWREFAHHILHHFPYSIHSALKTAYQKFPWHSDKKNLAAWHRGMTGYPIVDAGMRQLWATGWMHNRVRMITASFLVKDLLIDWRKGAQWFWDTLVDADLANNTLGWQWAAGCGADAAPYFRIFNPILQGEKFDKNGEYVRTWIPELCQLPARWIHKPWQAPADVLKRAKITLGTTYPWPIVDHKKARTQALMVFEQFKKKHL